MQALLTAVLQVLSALLTDIRDVSQRVDKLEEDMATLSELVAKLEEDATNVAAAIDGLLAAQAELKAIVEELKGQVPTQELQDRLDAVDASLDEAVAKVNPPVPPAPPVV